MLSYYNAKYEEGASGQKTSGGRRFSKWKAGLRRRVLQKTRGGSFLRISSNYKTFPYAEI